MNTNKEICLKKKPENQGEEPAGGPSGRMAGGKNRVANLSGGSKNCLEKYFGDEKKNQRGGRKKKHVGTRGQ